MGLKMEEMANDLETDSFSASQTKLDACGMSVEFLEDWLLNLATENSKNMKQANGKSCSFKQEPIIQLIFLLCDKCKQPQDVKYVTVEMFDKFMVKHIENLYKQVIVVNASKADRIYEWNLILEKVQTQMALRMVSCIQIASKLSSNYRVVTINKARLLLQEAGHMYSIANILKSELRVLQTLDYKVNMTTPAVYIDILLQILSYNLSSFDTEPLENAASKILDIVYLKWQDIYQMLYANATHNDVMTKTDRVSFSRVENDFLFLSVAVIYCASYIVCHSDRYLVVDHLEMITEISKKDINELAVVLRKIIADKICEK